MFATSPRSVLSRSLLALTLALAGEAAADDASKTEAPAPAKTWYSTSLNQDIFFGFTPTAQVGIGLTDTIDLTGYAVFWTIPAFGAGGSGQNLWTEFGAGVNVKALGGKLALNPQLGLLSGNLLSGTGGTGRKGLVGEGIVPNLTVNYNDDSLEAQFYGGYYIGTRTARDSKNNDFLHYWSFAGAKITPAFSVGAYWEHLLQTRGAGVEGADGVYAWFGPYVQFKHGDAFLRFAGGVDVANDTVYDFYKVSTGMTF